MSNLPPHTPHIPLISRGEVESIIKILELNTKMPPKSLKPTLVKPFAYNACPGSVKAKKMHYTINYNTKIELKLPCDNTAEFLPEL